MVEDLGMPRWLLVDFHYINYCIGVYILIGKGLCEVLTWLSTGIDGVFMMNEWVLRMVIMDSDAGIEKDLYACQIGPDWLLNKIENSSPDYLR